MYELICKEQAFITKFEPGFNSKNDVTSQFVRDLGETSPKRHSGGNLPKSVTITTMENVELITFSSISAAAKALAVSDNLLKRYADADKLLYIPLLGYEIKVDINNRLTTKTSVVHPTPKIYETLAPGGQRSRWQRPPPGALVHNLELPLGKVVAMKSDKSSIYETYNSSWVAAKTLG